ncbi:hypothetical protein NECAME_06484 [Necator americanus]|uniref:Uncharacterized protein n=1 Tax=Necator americanus TaxID=51031 RepID=W2TU12_NECAM|nr:hypothetical protein NECAME_06484 [Necator americanus]ETN85258.1 hypothetical protein NECAME_06484 [Necator americanus]
MMRQQETKHVEKISLCLFAVAIFERDTEVACSCRHQCLLRPPMQHHWGSETLMEKLLLLKNKPN